MITRYKIIDNFHGSHVSDVDMHIEFVILARYILSNNFQGSHDIHF